MSKSVVKNKWLTIGVTMLVGLFVAYLDRSNLSIALTEMGIDLGFAQDAFISSSVVTAFSIGYAVANVFGGVLTQKMEPKNVLIATVAIWSIGTLAIGFIASVPLLYFFRILLGVCEGFYWPQQSRIVLAWFDSQERTKANSIVQYYGQFLALAIGFAILTPINAAFGWRVLFMITGTLGLIIVVPLYFKNLTKSADAPFGQKTVAGKEYRLNLADLGGGSFFLLLFAYLVQGMLFWGITYWLPTVVKTLGFTGYGSGFMSGLPYLAAVLLAIPITRYSDKSGKRTIIASFGMFFAGVMLMLIGASGNAIAMIVLITLSMGVYASCFTPNIWTIVQAYTAPEAVGSASGIINGVGAGLGGTISGYLVGMMYAVTGSYTPGFVILGVLVFAGGAALMAYGMLNARKRAAREAAGKASCDHPTTTNEK